MCAGAGDALNFFWHSWSSSSSRLSNVFSSSISERVRTLCLFLSSSLSIIWKGLGTVTLEFDLTLTPDWRDSLPCGFGQKALGWNRNCFWVVISSGLSRRSLGENRKEWNVTVSVQFIFQKTSSPSPHWASTPTIARFKKFPDTTALTSQKFGPGQESFLDCPAPVPQSCPLHKAQIGQNRLMSHWSPAPPGNWSSGVSWQGRYCRMHRLHIGER